MDKFYAVTRTGVYEVFANIANGNPLVTKIRQFDKSLVGLGKSLQGGMLVCVGTKLVMYTPASGERMISSIHRLLWGGHTSSIIGLFETESEAMHCSGHFNRQPFDERWRKETREVLAKIGPDHPVFTLPDVPELMFPE
jgi:hypothetical protein